MQIVGVLFWQLTKDRSKDGADYFGEYHVELSQGIWSGDVGQHTS